MHLSTAESVNNKKLHHERFYTNAVLDIPELHNAHDRRQPGIADVFDMNVDVCFKARFFAVCLVDVAVGPGAVGEATRHDVDMEILQIVRIALTLQPKCGFLWFHKITFR